MWGSEQVADVVIVGGGIAGAALATVLARHGIGVVVLEATETFTDRVRGESLQPWGVAEAIHLDLLDVLVEAGARTVPLWEQHSLDGEPPRELPVGALIAGVDGSLNLAHPRACDALLRAAAEAGALVCRGVTELRLSVESGGVKVAARAAGADLHIAARLVVGADGRGSTVRRQAGIALERQPAAHHVAGLLISGVDADHDVMAECDDGMFVLFHQGAGLARAYLCVESTLARRYAGPGAAERFLRDCGGTAYPGRDAVSAASPAGPCAAVSGTDTWCDEPLAHRVVLVGDAAGHNDPMIGCGLSIALRDVRMVRDLILDGSLGSADFSPYAREREERMRRLRLIADVSAVTHVEPAGNRAARRAMVNGAMRAFEPEVFGLLVGAFVGPEAIPAGLVDERLLARVRAAGAPMSAVTDRAKDRC